MTVEKIDLSRHAVVEASAGTGKTYTIECLVERLLLERDVPLDSILVVTFTEKATAELKDRIRKSLERALAKQPGNGRIITSLEDFDQAPIFTIHAFCQRLLQEYPLEKGQDFRPELVDDDELLPLALREVQRRVWPKLYGKELACVLGLADFNRDTAEKWERQVIEIAKKFRGSCSHRIQPPLLHDWLSYVAKSCHRGDQLLEDLNDIDPDVHWKHMLAVQTIHETQKMLEEMKRQRGQQSFDDMIARVDEGLNPEHNPNAGELLYRLRQRFQYGVVDEFQDTDPLQWRIFRRLFLESGDSRLIVVGDPKQAIYGFRGADLPTYQQAVSDMVKKHKACSYPLTTNWRSVPELLEGLNRLYVEGDVFPPVDRINYHPVSAPPEAERRLIVEKDASRRPAINLVDVRGYSTALQGAKTYAAFVAGEIRRLLAGDDDQPTIAYRCKGEETKPIDAGDICILVFRRSEAKKITQELAKLRIPYTVYKESGLWRSDEAEQIRLLLESLQRPDDPASFRKALLTRFFRLTPAEIASAGEVPSYHPARRLFLHWAGLAETRRWSALFQSLLEQSGVIVHEREDPEFERHQANYRTILSSLEQTAYRDNGDLLHLIDFMRHRRTANSVETDYQPMETQRPKVRIMTIHASKGLEFPVVFFAGGFTNSRPEFIRSYRDGNQRLVFDLVEDDSTKWLPLDEKKALNRRLTYVALTRAMIKLYIPFMEKAKGWSNSPVTLLTESMVKAKLAEFEPAVGLHRPGRKRPEPLPFDAAAIAGSTSPLVVDELFPLLDPNLHQRRITIQSFSSLHRTRHAPEETIAFGEGIERRDETEYAIAVAEDPLRGAAFGDVVHQTLEEVDFAEIGRLRDVDDMLRANSPTRAAIDKIVHANLHKFSAPIPADQLESLCRSRVASLVWNALRTPLSPIGGALCDVPVADRLQELAFDFPEHEGNGKHRPMETFVTGFMDLVFRRRAKIYLLDWKTNLLPAYGPEEIAESMDQADYHRQYRLYLVALVRWLKRIYGSSFDYDGMIGGVFYLYVRGMNGKDDRSGVYYRKPSMKELQLAELLA
jgi:exodeoxyribonuclease V beta subunit